MNLFILVLHENDLARSLITFLLEKNEGFLVHSEKNSERALLEWDSFTHGTSPNVVITGSYQHASFLQSSLRKKLYTHGRTEIFVIDESPEIIISSSVKTVSMDMKVLLLKLKSLKRFDQNTDSTRLEFDELRLEADQQKAFIGHLPLNLTPIAFRSLYFFMRNHGRCYSRSQLLDSVWNDQTVVEDRTVDVQVYRLRNQLAKSGYGHLIEAVRDSGYRFVKPIKKPDLVSVGLKFAS